VRKTVVNKIPRYNLNSESLCERMIEHRIYRLLRHLNIAHFEQILRRNDAKAFRQVGVNGIYLCAGQTGLRRGCYVEIADFFAAALEIDESLLKIPEVVGRRELGSQKLYNWAPCSSVVPL
jgi:hypothetical protein